MKRIIPFLLLAFGVIVVGIFMLLWINKFNQAPFLANNKISSFDECVLAGYPIQESYPRKCTAKGKIFTEDIGNALEKQDLIILENPRPNSVVKNPLKIEGKARGNWFFEADFPVKIVDQDGKVLGSTIAFTTSDWMTQEFVPFKANLTFKAPATKKGKLILEKDNPSGLKEKADFLEIPVKFE